MLKHLFRHLTYQVFSPGTLLRNKYNAFREVLRHDNIALERIADLEEIYYEDQYADWARIAWLCQELSSSTRIMIDKLQEMSPTRYMGLQEYHKKIDFYIQLGTSVPEPDFSPPYLVPLGEHATDPNLTGGKASSLARIASRTEIPVLPGFVVTANAFNYFLESNGLRERLDSALRRIRPCKTNQLQELAREMEEEVLTAPVPNIIADELLESAEHLLQAVSCSGLILRSSAVAEDGVVSFAGQYDSVLNVGPENILETYKRILAGKYRAKALFYRILYGLTDSETPMAVLVQPMLDPLVSGVMYTKDPGVQDRDVLGIYAVPGHSDGLMDGTAAPCTTLVPRTRPGEPTGEDSDPDTRCLLDHAQRQTLVRLGLELERIGQAPQDVEWGVDVNDRILVLQTRPIRDTPKSVEPARDLQISAEILASGGQRAASGVASGPVHVLDSWNKLADVPDQCILLVPALSPELAQVVHRLRGVVARSGSRASHFASVARELGLPVLVHPDSLNGVLSNRTITLDADRTLIYDGEVRELLQLFERGQPGMDNRSVHRLGRVMERISRLTLTDPASPRFNPESCRSMHDLVRFVHEKSVSEMFSLVGKGGRGLRRARQLKSGLPISMYILDIDDGLFETDRDQVTVTPEEFKSVPMWALWWGLSSPDVAWDKNLLHVDWEEFDRISAGIFKADSALLSSYAVLSANYMHLMLRFGYHFSVVDALCGSESKNNYINFRFKGGGASFDGRLLRIEFITRVLTHHGFTVTSKADLLDARCSRDEEKVIQKRLAILGRLLAKTRLLDMRLDSTDQIDDLVNDFLEG